MNELEYLKKYIHKEDNLEEAIKRLEAGEPVQYIVGDVDFYGNIIKVNKNVLIPRRETEELVEKTVNYIKKYLNPNIKVLDIGTGSGCIPIALKKLIPSLEVSAVDISKEALEVATSNASDNNVDIKFIESDVFTNVDDKYDCIISNPPYITHKEKVDMEANVLDWEPSLALFVPDEDPLLFYRKIAQLGCELLKEGGSLYFEINRAYGRETSLMLKELGYSQIELKKDSWGNDRMIKAKR